MAYAAVPKIQGAPTDSPLDVLDQSHRLGLLLNYMQREGPNWAPGLRNTLHDNFGWMVNDFNSPMEALGLDGEDGGEGGFLAPILRPVSELMQGPSPGTTQAFWLTPGYHHKGFLPTHDAMTLGFNLRQKLLSDRLELDARPFYGQNWLSLNGYGGAELGIGLSRSGSTHPWGRIALRYVDGDSDLMDHGRGFDMHAELSLADHLALHAGVRGDEESELGNYVLLRWSLTNLGH